MVYKYSRLFKWSSGRPIVPTEGPIPVYGSNGIIGHTLKGNYSNRIIIGRVGAYCGSVNYCTNLFFATDNTLIAECNENLITYKFAYYLFSLAKLNSFASGSAQPLLTQGLLNRLKCDIPDLPIQRRIAEILSTYDYLIENNNKRIKLLEQMAENLYKEWFVRFRFPGYEGAETEKKQPRGWTIRNKDNYYAPSFFEYAELNKIGEFTRGKNVTSSEMVPGKIPVISAGLEPSGFHNKANVYGPNLTISASGANAGHLRYNLNDIWAADCSYYQNDENMWFVYNTLKFLQPLIRNLQCGAAQPHVYPKHINNLTILIPPGELIFKYNRLVSSFYDEIACLEKQIEKILKQRDLLLPRLMSGKLEV